jgi:hypothetical protein
VLGVVVGAAVLGVSSEGGGSWVLGESGRPEGRRGALTGCPGGEGVVAGRGPGAARRVTAVTADCGCGGGPPGGRIGLVARYVYGTCARLGGELPSLQKVVQRPSARLAF